MARSNRVLSADRDDRLPVFVGVGMGAFDVAQELLHGMFKGVGRPVIRAIIVPANHVHVIRSIWSPQESLVGGVRVLGGSPAPVGPARPRSTLDLEDRRSPRRPFP